MWPSEDEKQIKALIAIIENTPHTYYIAAVIKPYVDTMRIPSLTTWYHCLDRDHKAQMIPVIRNVVTDSKENESLRTLIAYVIQRFRY
jgi:hypothetical protein